MAHRSKTYLYDGVKAQSLDNLDRWMDEDEAESRGGDTHSAYATVPWVYRCVRLRANSLSVVPWALRKGKTAVEYPLDYMLPRLLWLTEAALCVYGAAYWLRLRNRAGVEGYRWLLPTSIKLITDDDKGLTGFERKVSATKVLKYKPEELVYFWEPTLSAEVGPGVSPVQAGLTAAGMGRFANEFAQAFFERGAIPATLLTVEGNPSTAELERLETWWKRLLQGVQRAWETVAVRATVKPQIIGAPIKDLAMVELNTVARQQIAVALGIPQTMIEDAANYATAAEHRTQFYENTIIPECGLIASALNEQVWKAQGMEFEFTPQDLDVMQEDEHERAGSLKALKDAGIPLVLAMQMLGYDLPEGWDYARLEAELNERRDQVAANMQGSAAPEEPTEAEGQPATEDQTPMPGKAHNREAVLEELRRWKRKATRKGGPVEFDTEVIPTDLAELLDMALESVGLDAWRFLKATSRADLEKRIKQIVGDVFNGALDAIIAAILMGQEPDLSALSEQLRGALQPELTRIAYDVGLAMALDIGIGFDPARLNLAAIEWSQKYVTEWVKGLTDTRRKLLRDVLKEYLTTPGLDNAWIRDQLKNAFGEVSAEMIAVTEITRAYSAATNEYQALLKDAGIGMQRIWNTSNDEKVCPICGPLNGLPEKKWAKDYPGGPPAHVNCRCWTTLEYVGRA